MRRQRKLLNPVLPKEDQEEVLYVHNPEQGVQIPANPEGIFAVVRIHGI
jgi:hypothetical protein